MKSLLYLVLFLCNSAIAETTVVKGKYEMHYNVFPSVFLTTDVAKNYQIKRSKNKALINISILKVLNEVRQPTEANVMVEAKNLLGQKPEIKLRKITEGKEAIYYIGMISVNNRETMNFKIKAIPAGSNIGIEAKLSKEFYTD